VGVTGARRTEGTGDRSDPSRSVADLVPDARDRARHELALQTVREFRKVLPAGVPAAIGLAVVLHGRLPLGHLVIWVSLVLVDSVRAFVRRRADDRYLAGGGSVDGWLRQVVPHGVWFGLVWGTLPVLCLVDHDAAAMNVALVVALAFIGVMMAVVAFRPHFLANAIGLGVPTLGSALWFGGDQRVLGVLGLLYVGVIVTVQSALARSRLEAAVLKHVNAGLARALTAEHERVQEANDQLSAANTLLSHRAHHDALTGLANRTLALDRLAHAMQVAPPGSHVALLYCDLDGFKSVNDRYGHPVGDQLLVAVASRLRAAVGHDDLVARLGGDEFLIVVTALSATEHAVAIAERIVAALRAPFAVEGHTLHVGVSVGLVTTALAVAAKDLVRRADDAMYRAKHGGRGRIAVAPSPGVSHLPAADG